MVGILDYRSGRAGDPRGDCDIHFVGARKGIVIAPAQHGGGVKEDRLPVG